MTPANILSVMQLAYNYVQRDLAAAQAAMKTMSAVYNADIGPRMKETAEFLLLLDEANADMEDLLDTHKQLKEQCDFNIRRQKQWRIMACKACIGGADIDDLIQQSFFDLIKPPPTDQELDEELAQLVVRLEAREQAQNEFGTLRQIVLREGT